jgi:hypothetical protein
VSKKERPCFFDPIDAEISPCLMPRSDLAMDKPGSARAMVFEVKFAASSAYQLP